MGVAVSDAANEVRTAADWVTETAGGRGAVRELIETLLKAKNRWDDLIPVIETYPALLGIGLSEGTAIVVTGDTFEVIGKWKVAVHDNTRLYQPWGKPYYVLSPGDVYNMNTRSMERLGDGTSSSSNAIEGN